MSQGLAKMERAPLEKEALRLGMSADTVARSPVYLLAAYVNDHQSLRSRGEQRPPSASSAKDSIRHVQERLAESKISEPEDLNDDAKTVVDMSYMTEHTNPADQKFARFEFLTKVKSDLLAAIKQNSNCLQANADFLDADDVQIVKHEIEAEQEQLKSVNTEIAEIQHWFQEMQVQKQAFYQQFLKGSNDFTGSMNAHFQRKLQTIQRYMSVTQPKQ